MSLSFDRSKVILINLKSHNQQQLFAISEFYQLSFEVLVDVKNDGFVKIWVESGGSYVIACSHESDPDTMVTKEIYRPLTKKDTDFLKKLKPIKTPKMPKNEESKSNYKSLLENGYDIKTKSLEKKLNNDIKLLPQPVELDLDSILDKISASGMDSLTKVEKEFLENLSKQ